MENVFKIHKQMLSTGGKSVLRNAVYSFSYAKGFVESFLGYLRGTIADTVPTSGDSQSMLDNTHLEFKSHDF